MLIVTTDEPALPFRTAYGFYIVLIRVTYLPINNSQDPACVVPALWRGGEIKWGKGMGLGARPGWLVREAL